MRDHSLVLASLLALAFALAGGCANRYPTAPEATPSPISSGAPGTPSTGRSPTPVPTGSPSGPPAEIEIEIRGGPYAGSYRAVAFGGCDSKPDQNTFTVT